MSVDRSRVKRSAPLVVLVWLALTTAAAAVPGCTPAVSLVLGAVGMWGIGHLASWRSRWRRWAAFAVLLVLAHVLGVAIAYTWKAPS